MQSIGVLGAGIMGAGIAQVAAQGGYNVLLRDLQHSLIQNGLNTIETNLDLLIEDKKIDPIEKSTILSRIKGTTDLSALSGVDLVIEAVVENLTVKKQLFAELDSICAKETILATNTSSLSITEIAAATQRSDRVLGMHFFNPVQEIDLVELVKGFETSDASISKVKRFLENINKEYITVKIDSPGFIVNRVLLIFINEAISVYGEDVASAEDIDRAMKLGAGMTIGPLELADKLGLDNLYGLLSVFYNEFKDVKYRPHNIFTSMVRAGYWGRKTEKGFYKYED